MTIRNELIDELLAGRDPASVLRQDGLLGELKQALLNRLMAAEFDHHREQGRTTGEGHNHRNGATRNGGKYRDRGARGGLAASGPGRA